MDHSLGILHEYCIFLLVLSMSELQFNLKFRFFAIRKTDLLTQLDFPHETNSSCKKHIQKLYFFKHRSPKILANQTKICFIESFSTISRNHEWSIEKQDVVPKRACWKNEREMVQIHLKQAIKSLNLRQSLLKWIRIMNILNFFFELKASQFNVGQYRYLKTFTFCNS